MTTTTTREAVGPPARRAADRHGVITLPVQGATWRTDDLPTVVHRMTTLAGATISARVVRPGDRLGVNLVHQSGPSLIELRRTRPFEAAWGVPGDVIALVYLPAFLADPSACFLHLEEGMTYAIAPETLHQLDDAIHAATGR